MPKPRLLPSFETPRKGAAPQDDGVDEAAFHDHVLHNRCDFSPPTNVSLVKPERGIRRRHCKGGNQCQKN
jgi:hypothetical protein